MGGEYEPSGKGGQPGLGAKGCAGTKGRVMRRDGQGEGRGGACKYGRSKCTKNKAAHNFDGARSTFRTFTHFPQHFSIKTFVSKVLRELWTARNSEARRAMYF